MSDFGIMQYAASGMDAQHSALDVLARNVAVTQTADRTHPVHPLVPQFAVLGADDADDDGVSFSRLVGGLTSAPVDRDSIPDESIDADDKEPLAGQVAYTGAAPSPRAVTGVDAVSEMVSVLGAQRSFEADASVFDAGKQLIQHTLEVENAA